MRLSAVVIYTRSIMMQLSGQVDTVLEALERTFFLEQTKLSVTGFLVTILSSKHYENDVVVHLQSRGSDIVCKVELGRLVGGGYTFDPASKATTAAYAREFLSLLSSRT